MIQDSDSRMNATCIKSQIPDTGSKDDMYFRMVDDGWAKRQLTLMAGPTGRLKEMAFL